MQESILRLKQIVNEVYIIVQKSRQTILNDCLQILNLIPWMWAAWSTSIIPHLSFNDNIKRNVHRLTVTNVEQEKISLKKVPRKIKIFFLRKGTHMLLWLTILIFILLVSCSLHQWVSHVHHRSMGIEARGWGPRSYELKQLKDPPTDPAHEIAHSHASLLVVPFRPKIVWGDVVDCHIKARSNWRNTYSI